VPPTISGVALKLPTMGGWLSRQRFGSMRLNSANTSLAGAVHSPPSGVAIVRTPSGDGVRQATFNDEKFAAVIRSSGEYLLLARSPP
jgi:hypothetical protein